MKKSVCLLSCLLLFTAVSQAATLTFIGFGPTVPGLSPLNENPPHPESSATGTALVTWDTVTNHMTVNVIFSGLTTPNTAAHIHCCVDAPGNAGVATTTPTFTGFPTGSTSGTYVHDFDMTIASSFNPAFITAQGGLSQAMAALLNGLLAGRTYLNIHSQQFGGGEMRGFMLTPVDISIKGDSDGPAPINPRSRGTIPVAILSTATFDATAVVDADTVTFGRTGNEKSLARCNSADVNGDGRADLMCHFNTQDTGFQSGDTQGTLKAKTLQGLPLVAQDAIVIRP